MDYEVLNQPHINKLLMIVHVQRLMSRSKSKMKLLNSLEIEYVSTHTWSFSLGSKCWSISFWMFVVSKFRSASMQWNRSMRNELSNYSYSEILLRDSHHRKESIELIPSNRIPREVCWVFCKTGNIDLFSELHRFV